MDYFSTTINGIGKVVSVDYELVSTDLCDNEFIKDLGVEILAYADNVYVVIDEDEDMSIGLSKYHVAHLCVSADMGMEKIYEIRDAIERDSCKRLYARNHATVSQVESKVGVAYNVHI